MPFSDLYPEKFGQATKSLMKGLTQLDRGIQELPMTLSTRDRRARIIKLKKDHHARVTRIKRDYALHRKPSPESTLIKTEPDPHFAKLPQEIQDLIWEQALPGPRVVPLNWKSRGVEGLTSPLAPPAMLHVCRASRQVALKCGYELAFGIFDYPAQIYINFGIDTIYVEDPFLLTLDPVDPDLHREVHVSVRRIKNLAIGLKWDMWWDTDYTPTSVLLSMNTHWNLNHLTLATYLSDEWLAYGDVDDAEVYDELIPQLGKLAIQWRYMLRHERWSVPVGSDVQVGVRLLTNDMLRPWVSDKVRAKWEVAARKALKKTKPEFAFDPEAVLAASKAKLALFNSIAKECDFEYAENAFARKDALDGPRFDQQPFKRAIMSSQMRF
jgi:hypothetical protein